MQKNQMTQGPLASNLFKFALPLMASNLLQVLFNMSDIAVVGQFAGSIALGSVGSCATAVSLFAGLLIGMGTGINALTARYIGAGKKKETNHCVHTAFLLSIIYGLVIMTGGLLLIRSVLVLMGTKEELLSGACTYMWIYLCGTPALAMYNFGNGVMSAAGDTKRPLRIMAAAGLLNIILNLFFVIGFHLDAAGVALASAISQYFSAFVILKSLFHMNESQDVYLRKEDMHMDKDMAKSILALGIPTGLQNSIFAIANLFIQGAVNSFDTLIVEGNSAAANSDALVYDVMAAFYAGGTTFIAQNYGAGNKKRILDSYHISVVMAFIAAVAMGLCLFLFGPQFLHLFTNDPQVIEAGMLRLRIMSYSYCVSAFMDGTIAASRGIGRTTVPMIIVILGSCLFRILWIYTIFAYFHTIPALYDLYIASWSLTALFEIIYFRKEYKKVCNG